jgi:A/G-specific adenine glycosylase
MRSVQTAQSVRKFFSIPKQSSFRKNLLSWYDSHRRELPWRTSRDPYGVWISEIMLQQTRVAAVIEHYQKFLQQFPNVQKLAAARQSSLLVAWSGLGYYRRARMMHAAAKLIVRSRDGRFPQTAEAWQELPGIGRYTAAAIASIAFEQPVAVVDGNVERVLQRLSGKRLAGEAIWQAATALLDRERPGDFNQAMMELGATICTPRQPKCLTCPVVDFCAARGEMESTGKTVPQKKREIHYALVLGKSASERHEVLLVQRARDASLMAGMWELPLANPDPKARPLFTVRHSITVTDYKVHVWGGAPSHTVTGKWIATNRITLLPLTGLTRKILIKAGILDVRRASLAVARSSKIQAGGAVKDARM